MKNDKKEQYKQAINDAALVWLTQLPQPAFTVFGFFWWVLRNNDHVDGYDIQQCLDAYLEHDEPPEIGNDQEI